MTDQQQRTQWALDLFHSFMLTWTPPGAHGLMKFSDADGVVTDAIRAIAPPGHGECIGWAVFKREIDADWDRRQHPSGYVHTQVGVVFDKPEHAANVQIGQAKKYPDQEFVVCELRQT
jgi:hypothetical protein